jgi:hypothetical protein
MAEQATENEKLTRRVVPAELIETVPEGNGVLYWVLASPMLLFLAWTWVDLFAHYSPLTIYWLDVMVGLTVFALVIVLPLGMGAHGLVTALPGLFNHAGWDAQPLESVREAEQYSVRYRFVARRRQPSSWRQAWVRAAQGWVYLEIFAIFVGAVLMVPIFFSASEFGFGRP